MKRFGKSALLGSAAVAVMALGMSSPAAAFDNLTWTWNKEVDERVVKRIRVISEINPTGMTEVEKLQIQIGDVNATSTVHDIENNPIREGDGGGGVISIDETFDFSTMVDDSVDPSLVDPAAGIDDGDSPITADLLGGTEDEGSDELDFQIRVQGDIPFEFDPGVALDAETELPAVVSAATAVGNNQSITSSVSTQLHDAQILFDVCGECGDDGGIPPVPIGVLQNGDGGEGGNAHTDIALTTALAAAAGLIDKADITASSEVYNILNATVDSQATAVGNNMNVEVDAVSPGDALLIADITQVSVADVTATSSVYNVSINGYSNLASVSPIVNSAATAVGNNLNITVTSPGAGGAGEP